MRILKARSALLSDFEVLKVLKEMEAEQQERLNSTSHISEISEDADAQANPTARGDEDDLWLSKVPENLRTIQYEVSSRATRDTTASARRSRVRIWSDEAHHR